MKFLLWKKKKNLRGDAQYLFRFEVIFFASFPFFWSLFELDLIPISSLVFSPTFLYFFNHFPSLLFILFIFPRDKIRFSSLYGWKMKILSVALLLADLESFCPSNRMKRILTPRFISKKFSRFSDETWCIFFFFTIYITRGGFNAFCLKFSTFPLAKSEFFANQLAGRTSSWRFSMHRKVVWVEMFTKTGRWKFAEFHHQLSVFIKRLKTRTFIVILYNDSYLSFRDKTSARGLSRIGFEYIICAAYSRFDERTKSLSLF